MQKEKQTSHKKGYIAWIVLFLLSLYFARFFTNIFFPQKQLFLDTDSLSNGNVVAFVYNESPQQLYRAADGSYQGVIHVRDRSYELSVTAEENEIKQCAIDGVLRSIIPIKKYTTSPFYANTYCIQLHTTSARRWILFGSLLITWMLILARIYYEINRERTGLSIFAYSDTAIQTIGKKPILISFLVAIISLGIYYGCDLPVISETIVMWQKGIDIYQLDACINEYKNMQFFMWQYEGAMLAGYSLPSYIAYPMLSLFRPDKYHWIQAVEYKLINMLLINGTVLAILSFMQDKRVITAEKTKLAYYFAVYNPMVFWIAIIFIQFDMLPVYCITLGLLLVSKVRRYPVMAAFFLGYGIACKVTGTMFLPSILLLVLSMLCLSKEDKRAVLIFSAVFLGLVLLLLIAPRVVKTPIKIAFHAIPQAERIWYTSFYYLTDVILYVAIAGLVFAFLMSVLTWDIKSSVDVYIMRTLFMIGVITLVFSSLTLSTPSFYMATLPAFVLVSGRCHNKYELLLKNIPSVLAIVSFLIGPIGDITATLQFFGKQPIFTPVFKIVEEKGATVQWGSFLFTISAAGMFAYMMFFWREMQRVKSDSK